MFSMYILHFNKFSIVLFYMQNLLIVHLFYVYCIIFVFYVNIIVLTFLRYFLKSHFLTWIDVCAVEKIRPFQPNDFSTASISS